jgi:hypothetical protein
MTTLVHTDSRNYQASTDTSIVSTGPFHNEFYSYTTSINAFGVTTGTFSIVSGATATTCPRARVLHLTGRKLYPDVNAMTTFVAGSPLTSKKFLVSVYDPISFLTGFIDPTSSTFAKYDQNLPNFFDLGRAGSGIPWSGGGQGSEIVLSDAGVSQGLTNTNSFYAGYATVGQVITNSAGTIRVISNIVRQTSKIIVTLVGETTGNISSTQLGNFQVWVTGIGDAVVTPNNLATYGGPNPYVAIPGTLQFTINFSNTIPGNLNQRANFLIIN